MLKVGLVGIGAIARSQHFPVLAAHPQARLVAAASRHGKADVPTFPDLPAMLVGAPEVEAVVLCLPPAVRFDAARAALEAGRHVFLEKPPGNTVAEVQALAAIAQRAGVTLYASWHSRHAPAVPTLKARLADAAIRRVVVEWKEDVRVWHPGQAWIWQPGGFGVFDPGINALSILTEILPRPLRLLSSRLSYPENRGQPIHAELAFRDQAGVPVDCTFDWDFPGDAHWNITADTDAGTLRLEKGGARLSDGSGVLVDEPEAEYRGLYDRFVALCARRESEVDVRPLMHVADAFLCGERHTVGPFTE